MKQTVTILTALMIALLIMSGVIVMGSTQQSEILMQREEQLLSRTQELAERNAQIVQLQAEAVEGRKRQTELTKERDALSQQLNDAVLSAQESNDAVASQTERADALQKENDWLRARVAELEDEASIAAAAREEQTKASDPLRAERRVNH